MARDLPFSAAMSRYCYVTRLAFHPRQVNTSGSRKAKQEHHNARNHHCGRDQGLHQRISRRHRKQMPLCTLGVISEAPLPDLFWEEYGPIPLPLALRDIHAICKERTDEKRHLSVRATPPGTGSFRKSLLRLLGI